MRRPNPPVIKGRINSILGGTGIQISRGGLEGKLDVSLEHGFESAEELCFIPPGGPICTPLIPAFTQTTLDSRVTFPTFGAQTFSFIGHALLSGGDISCHRSASAYLGGSGTLATVDQLALGGDRLLFLQGDYLIPIERIQLPFLGSPFVALRYAAGNAGIRRASAADPECRRGSRSRFLPG